MSAQAMTGMSRRRMLGVGGAAFALAACGSGSVPRDEFYRLAAQENPPPFPAELFHGTVEVPPLRADGLINERAILYRDGQLSLTQYSYHAWLEPPSVMIQRRLVEGLRASHAFTMVATPEMRLDRDYELLGTLRQWEHVPDGRVETAAGAASASSVAIEFDLALRQVNGNRELLAKTYRTMQPAADSSVSEAVVAFSHGLDRLVTEFVTDLGKLPAIPAR